MKFILLLTTLFTLSCASINENTKVEAQNSPLMNGQSPALDTLVTNLENKSVKISTIIEKKPTVLVFYRGGWCPYCNLQLAGLRKITKDINKLGYQLVAVSPDSVEKFKETVSKNKLDYQVISDSDLELSNNFGLSFKVDDETLKKYKTYGIDLEEASGKKHHSLPYPAIYVLDSKGLIHFSYVNPNYKIRMNEKILLAALKELKLN